jgi:hypothetical protein
MIDPQALKLKRYLGDGVYAGFDQHQLWLWAERDGFEHAIAIEAETWAELCRYSTDVLKFIAAKATDRDQI